MIIRSAYLEGHVQEASQQAFDAHMTGTVAEAILQYPGIKGLSIRKQVQSDPDMKPIYMQFDLSFESVEAMDAALASEMREKIQNKIRSGMAGFEGRVTHAVYDVLT